MAEIKKVKRKIRIYIRDLDERMEGGDEIVFQT